MQQHHTKFYLWISAACLAGYAWLLYNLYPDVSGTAVEVCFFKNATGLPCPSCGSTRSVLSMLHGNFSKALFINPLGYIIGIVMLLTPLWVIADFVIKRNSLPKAYERIQACLRRPAYAVPLILLIALNWIWSISKSL